MHTLASQFTAYTYRNVVKPIFFSFDAENVHDLMTHTGVLLGNVPIAKAVFQSLYAFEDPSLRQKVAGIEFANPIGLSAGFDYDAKLTQVLPSIGFGFETVGTITSESYEGNQKPRLGRLPKSKSLLVNKGFKSGGVAEIVARLKALSLDFPVGVSVGATNKAYENPEEQVRSYLKSFNQLEKKLSKVRYYELNISCPNLKSGESFTVPRRLNALLDAVETLRLTKPLFIKMPTDTPVEENRQLVKVAQKYDFVTGLIFGNLTKDRLNPALIPDEIAQWEGKKGNFSGKPVQERADALLSDTYLEFGDRFVLIGTGGVFSADDAYRKIQLGASLVQLITGMIYEGPQVIGQINQGLLELLKRDGFDHIAQAIGSGQRSQRKRKAKG